MWEPFLRFRADNSCNLVQALCGIGQHMWRPGQRGRLEVSALEDCTRLSVN